MKTLEKHRVSTQFAATVMLPTSWKVANLTERPDEEARRLASVWLTADDVPTAAPQFVDELSLALQQARAVHATFAAILAGDGDVPVAGSLVATDLKAMAYSPGAIELDWRAAGRECSRLSLPIGPAVVTERTNTMVIDSDTSVESWEMQVAVPARETGGVLLVFSTPMSSIADSFRTVALAITSTLRWQQNGK